MNIFLSWSGAKSKKVATLFKEWLPQVIQALKPWLSTQDIRSGSAWHNQIQESLKQSTYGIFCITEENKETPWILYEAGAISKGNPDNRVCTFLVDLDTTDLLKNPLSSFNHTLNTKESLFKLLKQMNNELGDNKLADEVLKKVFEKNYPDFEVEINTILEETPAPPKEKGHQEKMLEEILNTVRRLECPNRVRNLTNYLISDSNENQPFDANLNPNKFFANLDDFNDKWLIPKADLSKYLNDNYAEDEPYKSEAAKPFINKPVPKTAPVKKAASAKVSKPSPKKK